MYILVYMYHGFYTRVWDMYRARAVYTYSMRAVHIPCTVKTMRQLSCNETAVLYNRLPLGARMSILVRTVH